MDTERLRGVRAKRLILFAALLSLGATPATAAPARSAFALFTAHSITLNANRITCGITDAGSICVDPGGSPVNESGFWPTGSRNNYVYNSGLQIAGIIPGAPTAGFPWPGDTVGAYFFDPRGDQHHGSPVTSIYDSRTTPPNEWPPAAQLLDTALFAPALIGRNAASQQDSWVRYWDGNAQLASGRRHTTGLLVEQRTMAWNYPRGNEDIIYEIFRIVNITAADASRYSGLSAYGYSPSDIATIGALGQAYQARARIDYGVNVPDTGFTVSQMYVAYTGDWDIGDAGRNYTIGSLPFRMVAAYKSDFYEPSWTYPTDIFSPPFAQAPGLVGQAFLKTPGDQGVAIMSQTTGGGQFPDAVGVSRLWRNLSLNMLPTDGVACNVPPPYSASIAASRARHQCFWGTVPADVRSYESVGPLTLGPGQAVTFVMALVMAAPLRDPIAPYIGTSYGLPPSTANGEFYAVDGTRLAQGLDTLKRIDSAMGWVSHSDVNGDGTIEPNEVVTVPRSLLWKIQLAQTMAAHKFLLPGAPATPNFLLVPGDRNITVVWQPSPTEQTGDPFFGVAADPTSSLYDPDYRRYDVEGYRIWRGLSPSSMQVIAQFDYKGTHFDDVTGQFLAPEYGFLCAPEYRVTKSCPLMPHPVALAGSVVQVRPGIDRVQLLDSSIAVLRSDTAVVGRGSGYPPLRDTGVPFVFVDTTALNGVTYFYAVSAFDVNSIVSGPSSMESAMVPRFATPRVPSGQETPGTAGPVRLIAGDGTPLSDTAAVPAIDPTTAIFAGPMPPTNGISLALTGFVPQLFTDSGTAEVAIDSVTPSYDCSIYGGPCLTGHYFLHAGKIGSGTSTAIDVPFVMAGLNNNTPTFFATVPLAPAGAAAAARFGGITTFNLFGEASFTLPGAWEAAGKGRYWGNCTPNVSCLDLNANRPVWRGNGARWWTGAGNEPLALPTDNVCQQVNSGGCVDTTGNQYLLGGAGADSGRVNGALAGIRYLWAPQSYWTVTNPMRVIEVLTSSVYRAADFRVYWNAATAGVVDSVIDVTHRVRVPFAPNIRASWGILNDSSFVATPQASTPDGNNGLLTFTDLLCVDPIPDIGADSANACGTLLRAQRAVLMDHARANAMNWKPASTDAAGGAALAAQGATGNGFIFYLNGQFFVMQLASNLAACCQGTVWSARFYVGFVRRSTINNQFSFGLAALWPRPPAVPGLRYRVSYTGSTINLTASNDSLLARVHTVPDPYYLSTSLEWVTGRQFVRFVNIPAECIIRIYSSSGILTAMLSHNSPAAGGEAEWDLTNRSNRLVASGVYFWELTTADGRHKIGRMTVITGTR